MPRASRASSSRIHIVAGILGMLAACAAVPPTSTPPAPSPTPSHAPLPTAEGATPPAPATEPAPPTGPAVQRRAARWVPVDWSALPGYGDDRLAEWRPALRQSCSRPAAGSSASSRWSP